jgi:hypothetical protein
VGLVDLVIVALLLAPPTARDFQLAEFQRSRRRARAGRARTNTLRNI